MFSDNQKELLAAPLDSRVTKTLKDGPMKGASYIEAYHAINEANRIFGFDGWSRETVQIERIATTPYQKNGTDMIAIAYMARVRITAGGVSREGCGYGDGQAKASQAGSAHELALKEAESDAMKRALMTFGYPFGLALYDKTQANVSNTPVVVRRSKENSRADYTVIQKLIDDAPDLNALKNIWVKNYAQTIQTMHVDFEDSLTQEKDSKKHELTKIAA